MKVSLKLKRQKGRKGPTASAKKYKIGKRKKGNDGRMWEVVKYAKGRRWKAVSKKKSKAPIHPSLIGRYPSEDVMRKIDDLADWRVACQVSKWHREFCNSAEGKDIQARLEGDIADKLNEAFDKKFTFGKWIGLTRFESDIEYDEEGNVIDSEPIEIPKEIGYLTNLEYLDLSGIQLKKVPKEIGNLSKLTFLQLGYNQLEEIPKEIGNLIKLEELHLQTSRLKTIPKELGNLINLKHLNVSNNLLKEIPKEIGNLINLNDLYLHNNRLETIPNELGNLSNLNILDMHDNRLKKLPHELSNLNNISRLDISGNQLTNIPASIGILKKTYTLRANPHVMSNMKYMYVYGNNFENVEDDETWIQRRELF